jgi:hypothetical protein
LELIKASLPGIYRRLTTGLIGLYDTGTCLCVLMEAYGLVHGGVEVLRAGGFDIKSYRLVPIQP